MNGLIGAVGLLLVVVQYGSFNPDPLNDLTINFNVKDSTRAFADNEFEADTEDPHPVVIGGITTRPKPLKDLEIFVDEWILFPPAVPYIIYETAAVTYQNILYLVGGMYRPHKKAPLQISASFIERNEYDKVEKWYTVNDLNYKRRLHTATVVDTTEGPKVFVTGGVGDTEYVPRSVEVYTLGPLRPGEKREWVTKPKDWDMNLERIEHAAVLYKRELYVIGGRGLQDRNLNGMRTMEVFRGGKWILFSKNPKIMKKIRMGHGAEVFDDIIVVCGGKYREAVRTELIYLRSCETFNGVQWDDKNIGDMNHKRSNFGLMFYGDKLWAFGGYNEDGVLSSVEFLMKDPQSNKPIWKLEDTKNFLKTPRAYFGVAKYSISPQPKPSKKRILAQENIVNSTFV